MKILGNCKTWEILLAKYVMQYRAFGGNKIQLLGFNGLPWGDIGVINVYAPKSPIEGGNLWEF